MITDAITKKAYGKVNLFLSVGKKRPDGMHDVETVLCRVGIYDTVTVCKADAISLCCDDKSLPVNGENIAYAAAERYFEAAGVNGGAEIFIEKKVPVKAGMGGGSSDAAATLLALNELYGLLSFDKLAEIASSLGADVPFFLYEKDIMLGKGTGASLTPCGEWNFELYGLFVSCGEKPSTGKMYSLLDLTRSEDFEQKNAEKLLAAIEKNELSAALSEIHNDFEICYEGLADLKMTLAKAECKKIFLCGSGPTVCALFESEESALKAKKIFRDIAFVCKIGTK